MREDLQIDFSQETFFGHYLPSLPRNVSIQNPPPPHLPKKSIFVELGRPIRDMLSIFRDDRSTTLFTKVGLLWSPVVFNDDMPSSNKQQIINCKNRYILGVRETSQGNTSPTQTCKGRFSGKKLICPESLLNNIKAS